ncbi:MAG: hypothetical protein GTN40_03895 [Candidatus Aenigmarchaeota archaeon]|nr:hypothetical protein [Candidatus Aenigmarchaeota archaeon]
MKDFIKGFVIGLAFACLIIFLLIRFSYEYHMSRIFASIPSEERAKVKYCSILLRTRNGCNILYNVSTNSIFIEDFDANRNGELDDKDTLFELCKNYYGAISDCECKKVCGCDIQCD